MLKNVNHSVKAKPKRWYKHVENIVQLHALCSRVSILAQDNSVKWSKLPKKMKKGVFVSPQNAAKRKS